MKLISIALILMPAFAFAAGSPAPCDVKKPAVVVKKPMKPMKAVVKPKPVIITKVVEVPKVVAVEKPCCDDKGQEQAQSSNSTQANHQHVTVNIPKPEVKIKTRKVYVYRETKRTFHVVDPNRLFLLIGAAKTNFTATADCCKVRTRTDWQPDFGAGYMRDLSSFSFGVIVTTTPSVYLAAGFNW